MKRSSVSAILINTEDKELNGIITCLLENKGLTLISVLNQRTLFNLIELYYPVIVIADSGHAGIMGFKQWDIIKEIERFRDTRIVLVTETSQNPDTYTKVDEIIHKDILREGLLSAICRYASSGQDLNVYESDRRLARAIVSDIVYYNSDVACRSAADGTFLDVFCKEIEQGRAVYLKRISGENRAATDYLDEAIREFIHKNQQCNLALP